MFLYDFDPENRTSDGPRPLDAVVAYNRLAQRLFAALTTATRRGRLYAVDLRLRPYGSHSPPAVQLSGFAAYHRDEAELWEHMALARARVVAGDATLGAAVTAEIAGILGRPRDPAAVCAEAGAMRALVARERGHGGPADLKLAPGALFDLDFLAQAIVLSHAHDWPACIGLGAEAVFRGAAARGLLPEADRRIPRRDLRVPRRGLPVAAARDGRSRRGPVRDRGPADRQGRGPAGRAQPRGGAAPPPAPEPGPARTDPADGADPAPPGPTETARCTRRNRSTLPAGSGIQGGLGRRP